MQRELPQFSRSRELASSQLKRSLYLFRRDLRARVEPDGSSSWVYGAAAGKLLFGREAYEVLKIQSGVKIGAKPHEYAVRTSPTAVSFVSKGQEKVQVAQSIRLVCGESGGTVRTLRLTNRGDGLTRMRVITLYDPTSLNYRRERDPPGEIGVNAFNRQDQVVMDDVGDTTGVRVIGFSPRPSVIYMTKDRGRAAELLALGELPESSLGMSGSIVLLTQHDVELAPGASADLASVAIYHHSSLEAALSAAAAPPEGEVDAGVDFASSSPSFNYAFDWAKASLCAIEGEASLADQLYSGVALSMMRKDCFERLSESAKAGMRKDGCLRHSEGREWGDRPGPVETALLVSGLCAYLAARSRDKKLAKRWYSLVKKAGEGLASMASEGLVRSPPDSPDGWRRRLGAGFPTGFSAEVNLVALRAFRDASTVARLAGKEGDSARFRELGSRLLGAFERLRDSETGALALNVDQRGVVHRELTIDQAVGLSFFSPDQNLASAVVHRLLEKDFETGLGPRTVPSSNSLYYSPAYGEGQLGGYWTRAAVSHALLAYSSGYPGIGSSQLEKVARLVHFEAEQLGGVPGEFPYWMDTERRQLMGSGSDPVAAARFIEAVVFGEGGLSLAQGGARLKVPEASQLRWLYLHGLDLGKSGSIFVGRSPCRTHLVSNLEPESVESSSASTVMRLPECELVRCQAGLEGIQFWDAGSTVLCLGNTTPTPWSGAVSFPLRSKSFSTSLFARLDELQQETGLWNEVERVKLLNRLELRLEVRPSSWKMLRLSRVS